MPCSTNKDFFFFYLWSCFFSLSLCVFFFLSSASESQPATSACTSAAINLMASRQKLLKLAATRRPESSPCDVRCKNILSLLLGDDTRLELKHCKITNNPTYGDDAATLQIFTCTCVTKPFSVFFFFLWSELDSVGGVNRTSADFCQRSSTSDGLGASCLNVPLKYVARPYKGEGAGGEGGGQMRAHVYRNYLRHSSHKTVK